MGSGQPWCVSTLDTTRPSRAEVMYAVGGTNFKLWSAGQARAAEHAALCCANSAPEIKCLRLPTCFPCSQTGWTKRSRGPHSSCEWRLLLHTRELLLLLYFTRSSVHRSPFHTHTQRWCVRGQHNASMMLALPPSPPTDGRKVSTKDPWLKLVPWLELQCKGHPRGGSGKTFSLFLRTLPKPTNRPTGSGVLCILTVPLLRPKVRFGVRCWWLAPFTICYKILM